MMIQYIVFKSERGSGSGVYHYSQLKGVGRLADPKLTTVLVSPVYKYVY
jgi:hypothetical protein